MRRALTQLEGNCSELPSVGTKHQTISQLVESRHDVVVDEGSLVIRGETYTVFGYVRNPWARMVSLYRYLVESRPRCEIDHVSCFEGLVVLAEDKCSWVAQLHSLRPQAEFFSLDAGGRPLNTHIGRYEDFESEFSAISKKIGLPPLKLGRENVSSSSGVDYRLEYNTTTREIVGDIFASDIVQFDYSFL